MYCEKILIVDDNVSILSEISSFLRDNDYQVVTRDNAEDIVEVVQNNDIDILILDIRLPGKDGITLLKELEGKFPELSVIMISGHGSMNTVIEAMRLGAVDYLVKPFKPDELLIAVERTKKYHIVRQQLEQYNRHTRTINDLEYHKIQKNFVGISSDIVNLKHEIGHIAQFSETNVMITGESGTGKEIIAKLIHYGSPLHKKPFIAVNCSAIPENLLESEFFGHVKGAFTGATENKQGYFELADNSTLFLDEIADMPLNLQAKLLRVIEEKEIMPVGSSKKKKVNVRLISATNQEVDKIVSENMIRNDLMHRLNTYPVVLTPLRERTEDIIPITKHYLKLYSLKYHKPIPQLSKELIQKLKSYEFPGNVRELINMVERSMILSKDNEELTIKHFNFVANGMNHINLSNNLNLDENEKILIEKALQKSNGHRIKAAKLLGISRDALKRRIKKFELDSDDDDD